MRIVIDQSPFDQSYKTPTATTLIRRRIAMGAKPSVTPRRRCPGNGQRLQEAHGRIRTKEPPSICPAGVFMAVAEGFEPSDGGYPSHAFEACSLGRSDTPPSKSLRVAAGLTQIAAGGRKTPPAAAAHSCASTPPADLRPVRQPPVSYHIPKRSCCTGFRFPRPNTTRATLRHHQRTGAHRARLHGDRQRRPLQPPPVAVHPGRRPQRQDLGMGRRVTGSCSRALAARASSVPVWRQTTTAPIGTSSAPANPAASIAA